MTPRHFGIRTVPRIPLQPFRPEHVMATGTSFGLMVAANAVAIFALIGVVAAVLWVAGVRL